MIKRRFYRQDRGDRDDGSSDSSSSSDSDLDAQTTVDSDAETLPQPDDSDIEAHDHDSDDGHGLLKPQLPSSSSSGYESEDSSGNEIDVESTGLPTNDEDSESEEDGERLSNSLASKKENGRIVETLAEDDPVTDDIPSCILRSKSVFKCRLCPKIVCLNMESLKTHLQSKRHARSEKLLKDGRLKRILNSDGEEEVVSEDDGETHAERHARILALAQLPSNPKKKSRGRQRQRDRLKRKKEKKSSDEPNSGQQKENRAKRRRKNIG